MTTSNKRGISFGLKAVASFAILLLIWLGRFAWDYFDPNSPASLSMQVQRVSARIPVIEDVLLHFSRPAASKVGGNRTLILLKTDLAASASPSMLRSKGSDLVIIAKH